jgi:hypothetical protein
VSRAARLVAQGPRHGLRLLPVRVMFGGSVRVMFGGFVSLRCAASGSECIVACIRYDIYKIILSYLWLPRNIL